MNSEILTEEILTVTITTSFDIRSYVNQQKAFWNEIAISYAFLGYIGGVGLLFVTDGWLNLLGIVLLTHSLICSAYLSHEFMHGSIFKSRYWNVVFGQLMLWLNGGFYYGFQTLTLQHIAHHVDRADVFTFDISAEIQKLPNLNRQIIVALEWLYFPAVSFWSRWQSIVKNWRNPEKRQQVTTIFAIRIASFAVLGIISFKALLLYFLSYVGMITVLRWMDAFQ
ncbi:MAG: fatty acid desaturase, partial [Waterburya sp.]